MLCSITAFARSLQEVCDNLRCVLLCVRVRAIAMEITQATSSAMHHAPERHEIALLSMPLKCNEPQKCSKMGPVLVLVLRSAAKLP